MAQSLTRASQVLGARVCLQSERQRVEQTNAANLPLQPYLDPPPVLVIITGPSGVGKDSIMGRMKELGATFYFVVTVTNRDIRDDERHGVDYYFVTTAEFRAMIDRDEFFESTLVYDQYKGVPKEHARAALASGLDVVMRVDLQGADTIRKKVAGAITIFLAPPSIEVLEGRLRLRGSDDELQIQARLAHAIGELARAGEYDYVVINRQDDLDSAARQVLAIMEAERRRALRQPIRI